MHREDINIGFLFRSRSRTDRMSDCSEGGKHGLYTYTETKQDLQKNKGLGDSEGGEAKLGFAGKIFFLRYKIRVCESPKNKKK